MRMRRKPWARPELAACPFSIDNPPEHKGGWHAFFARPNPIYLELGCGKGNFVAELSAAHPEINYLGVDIKSEVLVLAKRHVEQEFQKAGRPQIDNVKIMSQDIERIDMMLAPEDTVDRIYINFCNPWNKAKQHKKRLTHPRQLLKYRQFLRDNGEIWFKTDNNQLFEHSVLYFQQTGFAVTYLTRDLHQSDFDRTQTPPTEHEKMFTAEGIPTKFLIAVKLADWTAPEGFPANVEKQWRDEANRGSAV